VVLEVADIDTALAFYEPLGFQVVERADNERRVRTTTGSLDLELWEPRLGLADARGGVHVEFAVTAADPATAVEPVPDDAVESVDGGFRLSDPDGHVLTLFDE
jgi:catechol 2,3-dioxygenase-like lactoylglutathione lyase family enzyme